MAVLRRGDRYLIHRRADGVYMPGYWTPLSGRLEPGETQQDAVVREVAEEVGLLVRPVRKVWECDTHDGAYRLYWWLVEEPDPSAGPTLDPTEVAEVRWLTVSEFATMTPTFADDQWFFREIAPELP